MSRFTIVLFLMFATMACTLTGCFSGRPPRVAAPAWDVEGITDKAMEQCDEDNDGLLTKTELKNAPGLEYAFRQLDTDRDKKLSRDEVRQRFQDYLDSKMGIQGFSCYVLLKNGRPLRDGRVRLIPEPFLEGIIEVAEGDVVHDRMGLAEVSMTNDEGLVGVRSGMYRVEITSPSFKVGKKYNEETVLGVEISPFANAYEDPGGIKFRVGK